MRPGNGKRVVVVDDTQSISMVIRDFLRDEGFNVASYDDPIAALKDVLLNGADLVVTDYRMPEMNGLELLTEIEQKKPGTNGIIMTADPYEVAKEQVKYRIIEKTHTFIEKIVDAVKIALGRNESGTVE